MAVSLADIRVGADLPILVKRIDQERIDAFESWSPPEWHSVLGEKGFHTDAGAARQTLGGFEKPIASGRMAVAYAVQALTSWFGREATGRSARVDLRFLVPMVHGDDVQVHGQVTYVRKTVQGTTVNVEMWLTNQKQQKISVGTASVALE